MAQNRDAGPVRTPAAVDHGLTQVLLRTIPLYGSLLALALSLGAFRLADPDLGLHLAAGRTIALEQRLPQVGEFLYTSPDFYSLPDDKWLFRLACYALHQAGGAAGLIAGRMVLILWTLAALLFHRPAPAPARVLMGGLFLLSASTRLTLRPEMVSLALAATFLALLERWRHQPRTLIPFLAALQVLWVNAHGFFFFGPVLVAVAWVDARLRARREAPTGAYERTAERGLGWSLLVCLACCFLNPATWRGVLYPVSVIALLHREGGILRQTIRELRPTAVLFQNLSFPTSAPTLAYAASLGLAILGFILTRRRRLLREWLVLGLAAVLSLQFIRNVPFAALATLSFGPQALAEAWSRRPADRPRAGSKRAAWLAPALLAASLTALSFLVVTDRYYRACSMSFKTTGIGWSDATIPARLAAFVREQGFRGPLFNTFDVGSSLAWLLYPPERAFINGDTSGYPLEFYKEVKAEPSGPDPNAEIFQRFQHWDDRYHFRLAVLSYRMVWDRALMVHLHRSSEWALVYLERSAACFVRREGRDPEALRQLEQDVKDRLDAYLATAIPRSSLWKVHAASAELDYLAACVSLEWWGRVEAFARRALAVHPGLPERAALLQALGARADAL
ncbi:MAG: hypothetical protein HYU36_07545 [Planctomycetes bacterium]|nr:hypothetical protein [Planctomycetota bacterium]